MRCDSCNSKDLRKIYRSESTIRDLSLFICNECSLLQSFPKRSGVYPKTVSVTSGAAWGYIRYGKEQRLDDAITRNKLRTFTGQKGLFILANTAAYHRKGSHNSSKPRITLNFEIARKGLFAKLFINFLALIKFKFFKI